MVALPEILCQLHDHAKQYDNDECVMMKLEHDLFIDCLPYVWRSRTSDGLFLPIYPPRSMRVVLRFDN